MSKSQHRHLCGKALGRTRRVKEEPSDDVDNNPKKKAGAGRKKVVDEDGGETVQGKENTPTPSPISPTDAGAGFKDDKRAEKASKTSKVKTEEKTTTTTRATALREAASRAYIPNLLAIYSHIFPPSYMCMVIRLL